MMILNLLGGFLATLIATLTGVLLAFGLDRWKQQIARKQRNLDVLKSIRKELELNRDIADNTSRLVRKLQNRGLHDEADHYIIDLYSTDAWNTAIQEQIKSDLNSSVYYSLQSLYHQIRTTNEITRRLRTETLHPEVGKTENLGNYSHEIYTTTIEYYDQENSETDILGLAIMLHHRAREIEAEIRDLQESIDDQIDRIEQEVPEETSIIAYLRSQSEFIFSLV